MKDNKDLDITDLYNDLEDDIEEYEYVDDNEYETEESLDDDSTYETVEEYDESEEQEIEEPEEYELEEENSN